jgi:uncharacterized protein (TIRG00374 family)
MEQTSIGALKRSQFVGGVLLTLAVISYVLFKLDWEVTYRTFSQLNWSWLMIAFCVTIINYALRTLRFKILLNLNDIPLRHLFGVTNLYGMFLYLLPAKTGELTYPILLKNRLNVSLTEGAASLIVARFFDVATISLFLPFVLSAYWTQLNIWIKYSALAFIGIVFVVGLGLIGSTRSNSMREKLFLLRVFRVRGMSSITNILKNMFAEFQTIDQRGLYWQLWALSVGIWGCIYTNFYVILISLGFHVTYFQMIVVSIIMVPMTLLPIQGFANFGTHEIGWGTAFSLFGYSQSVALGIAINSHIILLFFILALGFIGYILLPK